MTSKSKELIAFCVASTTPFDSDGNLSLEDVPGIISFHKTQNKVPGLLICGSTGEQHVLSINERVKLYKASRDAAGPGYPLYAGVSSFKTKDAIVLAQAANEADMTGIMLGFPPYRIPSQHEAEQYVVDVCASIPPTLPVFLYNNPRRTGFDLQPETFVNIYAKVPNVLGLKQAGNLDCIPIIKDSLSKRTDIPEEKAKRGIRFYAGNDVDFVDYFVKHGYNGLTSIAGNVFPSQMEQVVKHLEQQESDKAKEIMDSTVLPLFTYMKESGVLQSIKFLLADKGVATGENVPPHLDLSKEVQQTLLQKLSSISS
eukprot:m.21813 g.21813  ORF g.21813 m.21813 type:complete len:313 (+) comp7230_c0_seq2:39-977(+)